MNRFNLINVIVSALTLIVLVIDFYITKELYIESSFLFATCVLLAFNSIRHLKAKLWSHLILGMISDLVLLGVSLFGFGILALTLFGYGFTGKEVQPIWILMSLCNVFVCSLTVADMFQLMKKRQLPVTENP